jgi:error-prone DNA polymerase
MYIELHAKSAFSFLESPSSPEDLVAAAAHFDLPAIALLDRDGYYGIPRFHQAAQRAGIRALLGAEISTPGGTRYSLLIQTRKGYQNLCRLITKFKLRAKKNEGTALWPEIAEYSEGLILLTGGDEGPFARTHPQQWPVLLHQMHTVFPPGRLYVEIQRHHRRRQAARNQALVAAARLHQLPLLATNAVNHATPQQRHLLDVVTCIRHRTPIQEAGKLLSENAERHLKSPAQMRALFADLPDAIENTKVLAESIDYSLSSLGYEFPRYPVPHGQSMISFLRDRTWEGAAGRYPNLTSRHRDQLQRELDLIEKLGLEGYFLIVWDIIRFCRNQGILVQGRGSAANSAVCYSLGITAVDPIGMELLFERFLSEERGEWPDIDLDLPSGDRRERAIQYIYDRYGQLGAAMTANVITFRGRSAAREVGKVLGFPDSLIARLSNAAYSFEWRDPKETAERQFLDAGLDPRQTHIRPYFELFQQIQDLPRHLGQHSGGMVICQGQLDQVVPLEPASMPGRVVVQWDKEDCADLGIVKVDLLGLGMMAVLEDSLHLIEQSRDERIDLSQIGHDDPGVYEDLQNADTIGVFQVESRAQQSSLPRMKPKKFYDIVVQTAIIRPGPIVGKMVHPYIRRRQGREKPEPLHPLLEPILARTMGVPLFQEQLLRMAMTVADFTGGEAEELRRALGFKRSRERMLEIEKRLRSGMTRKGISDSQQQAIITSITSFALYGFPESHAASFALLAYASIWLRRHYRPEFTAALLNNYPMGFYHPDTIIKDAQRHGLRVLPVDVTRSDYLCSVESPELHLRLGLNYVKGLHESAGRAIERERRRLPFSSLQDLLQRVPELNRDQVRQLAKIGALNPLEHLDRRAALWKSAAAARPAGPLLQQLPLGFTDSPLAPMNRSERMMADYLGTGVSVGRHPMAVYRERLSGRVWMAADLKRERRGTSVRVAGAVIVRQRPGTAKGFFFISLEDESGISNIICEPDFFTENKQILRASSFLVIEGILQNQDGAISIKARKVEPLASTLAMETRWG